MNKIIRCSIHYAFIALFISSCTVPDWREVTVSPLENIRDSRIYNPVLEATDVTDIENADFVADPFLFKEDGTWYMFFEVGKQYVEGQTHWGRIGLATSVDGIHWAYDRIVLDEIAMNDSGMPIDRSSLHHSYPQVIKHNDKYYMITESYIQHQIRFFEADRFPYEWRLVFNIAECGFGPVIHPRQCFDTDYTDDGIPDVGNIDPSIFRFNAKWWIYANKGGNGYIYHSDNLLSGWQEHRNNPVVSGPSSIPRAGGRVIVYNTDKIIRVAQERRNNRYGVRVRAFDVTTLSESDYSESELHGSAEFCTEGGVFCEVGTPDMCNDDITPCEDRENIWNLCGMHHMDSWWSGDSWYLVVDGYKCLGDNDNWAIGMFISGPPEALFKEPELNKDWDIGPIRPDVESSAESESPVESRPSPDVNVEIK